MYNTEREQWNDAYQTGKVLLIDKPLTWTSFDAVKKIRRSEEHTSELQSH